VVVDAANCGKGKVLPAIAIEIAHRDRVKTRGKLKEGRAEVARAIAQQDRYSGSLDVGDGEVLLAVAIEIAHCYEVRTRAEDCNGAEVARAIAQ
jgi:hypothetical protein